MIPRLPLLLAVVWMVSCHEMPPPPSATRGGAPMRIWSFEETAPGSVPAGWRAAETHGAGTPGQWQIAGDPKAPDGKQVMRLAQTRNSGETFNLMLTTDSYPADLDLAVWIHADAGEEDQGGGLVWRASDADNYWLARWNPLEENVRVYQVTAGKRRMLMSTPAKAGSAAWHELRVVARGVDTTVQFDGGNLVTVGDRNQSGQLSGGAIGLWTKADAATSFDQLSLGIPAPPQGPIPGPEPR